MKKWLLKQVRKGHGISVYYSYIQRSCRWDVGWGTSSLPFLFLSHLWSSQRFACCVSECPRSVEQWSSPSMQGISSGGQWRQHPVTLENRSIVWQGTIGSPFTSKQTTHCSVFFLLEHKYTSWAECTGPGFTPNVHSILLCCALAPLRFGCPLETSQKRVCECLFFSSHFFYIVFLCFMFYKHKHSSSFNRCFLSVLNMTNFCCFRSSLISLISTSISVYFVWS